MKTLLERKQGPFYDLWEALPETDRQEEIHRRLTEYIGFAREFSPFYRERLQGFDAKASLPMTHVPYLKTDDLRTHLPPAGSAALLSKNSTAHTVFQSGGTTGVPKTSLFTHAEMEGINACNARGFYGSGLKAEDRVANLWAVGGLYMTFVHMNRMLQEYGCTSFPFSNHTPVDFIKTVTTLFNVNVFTGITSVVLNALREIERKEPGALKVKKVYFGGEHIYDADRRELQETMGVELIKAPGYGTVDSWYLGYQCANTTNGIFHAFDDQVYLEILDEETKLPVVKGDVGMLFATAFERKLTPIIRFRVGDKARWMKEPCPCGRTTPLFQLLGRGDDVLRIGYDSLDYAAIQNVVSKVEGLSGMMQMEKRRLDGKDLLIIRVEASAAESSFAVLSKKLEDTLIADRPSLRDFMKKGTILPLQIELIAPGKLPLNPRTGKLIRVIDAI